jgi:4-amino-4-deoxy-L-arabinose transferase-like glycosyltransferase
MIIFSVALFVLCAGTLPWVALTRPANKTSWVLAFYLIASANITLTGYIANSLLLLNQEWLLLSIHAMLGGTGWLIWLRAGKPSVWGLFQDWRAGSEVQVLKRDPALLMLTVSISSFYAFAFAQVIFIPQNNVDSLAAHLSRIGFWLQNGSFFPWQTFMPSQIWYPVNAQLQTYWTLLFLGNDHLVGGVQWLAALVSGVGVFGLARLFGYGDRPAKFAALIFLSFPLVALQATTTQTDLLVAVFFVPAVFFLISGLKNNQSALLMLSALSIGLGIGVKKSFFVLLPVLAVAAMLLLVQHGRRGFKPLVFWSVNVAAAIAIFGAYMYVFNWQHWGDPFGAPGYMDTMLQTSRIERKPFEVRVASTRENLRAETRIIQQGDTGIGRDLIGELLYNTPRLLYQMLDTSGLPRPLDGYAHKVKALIARTFFGWIGFQEVEGTAFTAPGHEFNFDQKNENEESHAWYGPLSVLLVFTALLKKTGQGVRQRSALLLIPAVSILIFLPLEIILRPGWDPFQGRYFSPVIALCAPLMAEWFKEEHDAFHEWVWGTLAVLLLAVTLLYNPAKPTLGKLADDFHVWNNKRSIVQSMQRRNDRAVYEMVEAYIPADATLGYYIPFFFMEYPLFGETIDRHLVTIITPEQATDIAWLQAHGVEYLLIPNQSLTRDVPVEYPIFATTYGWTIYAPAEAIE